jgi:para-nitrobenzyl esterase
VAPEPYGGSHDPDDWLTVNVWSPDLGAAGLPVMVYIYGGAYIIGESATEVYRGAELARSGVVVVSFNYRVGFEGFAQIAGAPANRGLLDQVCALRWVAANIAAFGGDPGNVTVFGESAGAGSVAALLVMPSAEGLFRRAIAQSVPGTHLTPELAADVAAAITAELGLRADIEDLRAVDPERLRTATDSVAAKMLEHESRWGELARTVTPFAPVVDGEVLPAVPWEALADGRARGVELIVGHNRDEYRLFMGLAGQLGQVTDDMAADALRRLSPGGEAAYREAYPAADSNLLFELVQSDWVFRIPALRLAAANAAAGGTSYLYELCWPAPAMGGILGACHGLDVPLVMGNLELAMAGLALLGETPTPEARQLSQLMRAHWTAFAAGGNPGWPPYTPEFPRTRLFDAESTVGPYPEEASRRIWAGHRFAPLGLVAALP